MEGIPGFSPPSEALEIIRRLCGGGFAAYFCGGCVRDALLGKEPKDYDIATSAVPGEVERLFPDAIPVGKAFGVMTVVGESGDHYEVATFRRDLEYSDGRRPDGVAFCGAREDAERRDFTVNALFYDPGGGGILDFVGGLSDLGSGIIRAVGDPAKRFSEDRLRLLRAVRFAARTGFGLEESTLRAVRELAPLASSVSPERIAAELEAMLVSGFSSPAFRMLGECGLLRAVLPEAAALEGVGQPPEFHPEGDVWVHTLMLLDELDAAARGEDPPWPGRSVGDVAENPGTGMIPGGFGPEEYRSGVRECWNCFGRRDVPALAWSALLHDVGKPATFSMSDRIRFHEHDRLGACMAKEILARLRRPNWLSDAVHDLVRRHIHFSTLGRMRKSKLRRWLQAGNFPLHLELHRIDCSSSHRMLGNWFFGLEAWRAEKALPPVPKPLLGGGDLLGMGMRPGPRIGAVLRAVEDARLEGLVSTPGEAREFVGRLLAGSGDLPVPEEEVP